MSAATVVMLGLAGLLAAAGCVDVLRLRIPNSLPIAIAALFLLTASQFPAEIDWVSHLAAAGTIFAAGAALFAVGGLGGGDVKLFAAAALWSGLPVLPIFLFAVATSGLVLALLLTPLRAAGIGRWLSGRGIKAASLERGAGLPYAVAIAAGSVAVSTQMPPFVSLAAFVP